MVLNSAYKEKRIPGESGIWVFVMGDMLIFALFFFVFLYYRDADLALYQESQKELSGSMGLLNTVVLLSSSWCVARFMHYLRNDALGVARRYLLLAILLGVTFGVVKFFEYDAKLAQGIVLTTNDFFMYYYMLTGIHMLHVILGVAGLIFVNFIVKNEGKTSKVTVISECAAVYWHMVDLLWIMLFPLLYLIA